MSGPRSNPNRDGFETRAVHAGQDPDPATGAVVPPIHLATTFAQDAVGRHRGYEYSRSGNPTRSALETSISNLEDGRHGFAFSSGLAAEDAVLRSLEVGDHLIIPEDAYGGTFRMIRQLQAPRGIDFSIADLTDHDALEASWRPETKMVWLETPSNPMLQVVDILELSGFVGSKKAKLVVDNTFATPYLQQPLLLGADIVVHSSTKYLGGHSDVVGGFACTSDDEAAEKIGFLQYAAGAVPSPFDCYLILRGVKTLPVRMDRHCENAQAVAEMLAAHPSVEAVLYPGLPDHAGHSVAERQMRGFGGMVSFILTGGEEAALRVAEATRIFTLAESLGAVESLVEHPRRMTHATLEGSPLAVNPGLLRLSVGLESRQDLVSDLSQALDLLS